MKSHVRAGVALGCLCTFFLSAVVHADVTLQDEYLQRLKISKSIDPHGPTPFGEQVNPYTGNLEFTQTDVTLEGTGPTIRITRNHVSEQMADHIDRPYSMGDWALAIPRIETLANISWRQIVAVDPGLDWFVDTTDPANKLKRCTYFDRPAYKGSLDDPFAGWNGMTLVAEDGNQQSVLKRNATLNPSKPSIAEASYFPAVTQQFWQVGCLPQTSNGEEGEAFLAVSPEGTKYWLNHLSGTRARTITESNPVDPIDHQQDLHQGRIMAWMYVTKIQDRFGNWVQYHYSDDKLDYIDASDGRYVDVTWIEVNGYSLISEIQVEPSTSPVRKWQYSYDSYGRLTRVTLPDQKYWSYDLQIPSFGLTDDFLDRCDDNYKVRTEADLQPKTPSYYTSTISHPSGLVGIFKLGPVWHGRSYVEGGCIQDFNHVEHEQVPPLFGTWALISKQFSGPGMATQSWSYNYSSAVGSTISDACASQGSCQEKSTVDVIDPAGNKTRHTYSTRWGAMEGKEIQTDYYQGTSNLLRSVTMSYASPSRGVYPSNLGATMMDWRSNSAKQETLTPVESRVTYQQGESFAWIASQYDGFGNPTTISQESSLSGPRSQVNAYTSDLQKWVVSQQLSTSIGGIEVSRIVYDPGTDLPAETYSFGRRKQALTYDSQGNVHTTADGNDNTTTLSGWKRGLPGLVTYADGTSQSADISDNGWINWTVDENGNKTSYDYDVMGRVTQVTYPTNDSTAWNSTNTALVQVSGNEYGIAAGHWRQTTHTGNGYKVAYLDALWRPVLVKEYDAADQAGTTHFVATSYNMAGQPAYTSYPMANQPGMSNGLWTTGGDTLAATPSASGSTLAGIHTTYDALGRPLQVVKDSELGKLTTTISYLPGFKRQTVDPNGGVTTEGFQAFDQPGFDLPTQIDAPESTRTIINRDVFGKPTAITRGGIH